jgi:molybdate transport system substrate-binding protein
MGMQALAAGMMALTMLGSALQAAEIKVIAATPLTAVMHELGARYESASGHKVVASFVSGPVVKQQIDAGEPFDLALSITPVIDALIRDGKLAAATRLDVAYAPLGVGVRAGAAKPDVSTVEAFKRALLAARSVAHSETGASGEHFKNVIQRLGIADEMKPKLRPLPADRIAQAVPSGEAEMIVVTLSVIKVPGAEVAGLLPPELQFYNSFAGAVGTGTGHADAASALLRSLTAPASAGVFTANGMEMGAPR